MSLRDALRRALWISFALVAVSVVAFWGLVKYTERTRSNGERLPLAGLPVFFNKAPRNARDLALSAMRRVAQDRAGADLAKAELVRLGGAALPHILPELDTLDSKGRGRVALALVPIAERMELSTARELDNAEKAVPFWTRFWQDRAIDYRPQVVRRLAARLAERSLVLRREDIQHLDTYAISALIDELGVVRTADDALRVRRISFVLAHVTGLPYHVERGAGAREARAVAERWHEFWAENGADFSTLDGPRRVTAMVTETRYAKWISAVLRGGFGRTHDGRTALEHVLPQSSSTLFVLLLALVVGSFAGIAWAHAEDLDAVHQPTRLLLTGCSTVFASLPLGMLGGLRGGSLFVLLLAILTTAALTARYARSIAYSPRIEWPLWARVRFMLGAVAPALGLHTSLLLSGLLGLEIAFGLPGLGGTAAAALKNYDVNAWMASALATALILLVLRHICDVCFAQGSGGFHTFLEEEPQAS